MKNILTVLLITFMVSSCSDNREFLESDEMRIETRENCEICVMTWNTFLLDTPSFYASGINSSIIGELPHCEGQDCIDRALLICVVRN